MGSLHRKTPRKATRTPSAITAGTGFCRRLPSNTEGSITEAINAAALSQKPRFSRVVCLKEMSCMILAQVRRHDYPASTRLHVLVWAATDRNACLVKSSDGKKVSSAISCRVTSSGEPKIVVVLMKLSTPRGVRNFIGTATPRCSPCKYLAPHRPRAAAGCAARPTERSAPVPPTPQSDDSSARTSGRAIARD